jgi:hypothetical protein
MIMLTCIKTGRFWRCATIAAAYSIARKKGLVDYTIEGVDQ